MTILLRAEFKDGAWHVTRRRRSIPLGYDPTLSGRASQVGRAWLKDWFAPAGRDPDPWRLEQLKSCSGDGETAIGFAELLAQGCVEQRDEVHEAYATKREASVRALVAALDSRGERVAGLWGRLAIDQLTSITATLIAAIVWAGTLIRTLRDSDSLQRDADLILAVHGEWSNRTRHVLPLIEQSTQPVTVLVLGRPRGRLAHLRRDIAKAVSTAPLHLVRPYSLSSALLSLGDAGRLLLRAINVQAGSRYSPPLMQQAAMMYRLIMGAASARWWRQQGVRNSTVIYGQTGLADTTLLELAQQATGSRTVHVVHGLATGPNFAGYSNHALFRCSFDAEYYRELGGYGECHARVLQTPRWARGARGWLLLTNLAHPMNRGYQQRGISDELRVLEAVRRAVDASSSANTPLAWKPHPIFRALPADERSTLLEAARNRGFTICDSDWALESAMDFEIVLSTASTVAVDILQLGVLPLIFDVQPIAPDTAIAQLPLRAADSAALVQVIRDLESDPVAYERNFTHAWQSVGPARRYDMPLIREICGRRQNR